MQIEVDNSATLRVLVTLRILIEEPDMHTKQSLAEKIGVSKDSIKKYFLAMRKAGFIVKVSDYPDYTYSVDIINELKNESVLTKFSSKRHKK